MKDLKASERAPTRKFIQSHKYMHCKHKAIHLHRMLWKSDQNPQYREQDCHCYNPQGCPYQVMIFKQISIAYFIFLFFFIK